MPRQDEIFKRLLGEVPVKDEGKGTSVYMKSL